MTEQENLSLLSQSSVSKGLMHIAKKVFNSERISEKEALSLFKEAGLGFLGILANYIREKKNKNYTYYIRNLHIEPTNKCIHDCKFCSYSERNAGHGWEYSPDEIIEIVKKSDANIREIHIVGGVHPKRDLFYYGNIIRRIKEIRPNIHIKAFSAVELDYMIKLSGMTLLEGLKELKNYGLNSIPGGGAEIFNEKLRNKICKSKSDSKRWLEIHEVAHSLSIPSNATILYGHLENYSDRIDHLNRLRNLQDKTSLFNAFIPLKFKNSNNEMSNISEVSVIEDLKNYAVSRIFLDNFPHIKAYWPMIGRELSQISLSFGVDDFDGTINDSTKIYSLAGAEDKNPSLNTDELKTLIKQAGRIPVERDALYNSVDNKK